MSGRITWEEMVKMCPELEEFRKEFHAWAEKNKDSLADIRAWSLVVKPRLRGMVGWYSDRWPKGHPMSSMGAWDVARYKIYQEAPMGWKGGF